MDWKTRVASISPLFGLTEHSAWGGEGGVPRRVFDGLPEDARFGVEFGPSAMGDGTLAGLVASRGWGALYMAGQAVAERRSHPSVPGRFQPEPEQRPRRPRREGQVGAGADADDSARRSARARSAGRPALHQDLHPGPRVAHPAWARAVPVAPRCLPAEDGVRPDWRRSQGHDPLVVLDHLQQRCEFAEFPERITFDTPGFDALFTTPVAAHRHAAFLACVVSLDKGGKGGVDLIVRPRPLRATP